VDDSTPRFSIWTLNKSLKVPVTACRILPRATRGRRFRRHVCPLFPFPSPRVQSFEEPPMKSRLIAAILAVGLLCISSQANAANLFGIMLGGGYGGCGCDNACGCDNKCGCENTCGCDRGCGHQRCCKQRCGCGLFSHCRSRCCESKCGCEVSCAAPSCAAPTCAAPTCEAAPSCGCEAKCGCDRGCGRCHKQRCCKERCCKQRCHSRCHRGCGCDNTCGCDMAPKCGCGA